MTSGWQTDDKETEQKTVMLQARPRKQMIISLKCYKSDALDNPINTFIRNDLKQSHAISF